MQRSLLKCNLTFAHSQFAAQPVNLTTTQFSHLAFVSVIPDGRPRQHSALLTAWLVRGFLPLPCAAGAKTNLPMCLKRREALSLGRFAELFLTCLNLAAAEVPCETAPFASFSGRAEKEGPARPERGPIFSSLVRAIKTASIMQKFYEMVLSGEVSLIAFIVMQVSLTRLHSLCSMQRERSKRNTRGGVSPTTPAHGASAAGS